MDGQLTIGKLARQVGVTTKAVRYYEKIGLLAPAERGKNRYRFYNESHVSQLRFIRRVQQLGLSLAEIADLMDLAREVRCNELRSTLDDLFARKIREHELKIAVLQTFRHHLQVEEDACACRAFVPDCDCLPEPEPESAILQRNG
jgi:MerR family copper efflux transcriptional regulator